ncbi:SDR family oxidoreductase [Aerococcus urinaeequi]|uniref:SDR family oxidoreductase n=1 Tax=Aerococcus urinaeequi TaxID=51665 RepID=UPI003D6ABA1C
MSNNLLVIGSESEISNYYLGKSYKEYENIVGIDQYSYSKNKYISYYKLDITNTNEIKKFDSILEKESIIFNKILFLSGVNYASSFASIDFEKWQTTINVNTTSILFILKRIFPYLAQVTSIVVLGSQNGVVAHENRLDYGTSKAALIHLVKNLSVEFSKVEDKDIRINAISPSYILSEKSYKYLSSNIGKRLLRRIPYKRFVELDDVEGCINFLFSNSSKAIRGQNIIIDYGYTIV